MTKPEKSNGANAAAAVVAVVSMAAGVVCFMYVAWELGGWTGVAALGGVLCIMLGSAADGYKETGRAE